MLKQLPKSAFKRDSWNYICVRNSINSHDQLVPLMFKILEPIWNVPIICTRQINSIQILKTRQLRQNSAKKYFFKVCTQMLVEGLFPRNLFCQNFASIFSLFLPFSAFSHQKHGKAYFDQHLECAAPKCRSKYTTQVVHSHFSKDRYNLNFQPF